MRARDRLLAVALLVVMAVASEAGVARAAGPTFEIVNPQKCYISRPYVGVPSQQDDFNAKVLVRGTGWTPGETVTIRVAGHVLETLTSVSSAFSLDLRLPDVTPSSSTASLAHQGALTASAPGVATIDAGTIHWAHQQVLMWQTPRSTWNAGTKPASTRITYVGAGLPDGRVYAHYLHAGRRWHLRWNPVSTFDFGHTTGPCGAFRHTATVVPSHLGHAHGYYVLLFDTERSTRFLVGIDLRLTLGTKAALLTVGKYL